MLGGKKILLQELTVLLEYISIVMNVPYNSILFIYVATVPVIKICIECAHDCLSLHKLKDHCMCLVLLADIGGLGH